MAKVVINRSDKRQYHELITISLSLDGRGVG